MQDRQARRCSRLYADTGRYCPNKIEWYRRADALYCSERCSNAARDQRKRARRKLANSAEQEALLEAEHARRVRLLEGDREHRPAADRLTPDNTAENGREQ